MHETLASIPEEEQTEEMQDLHDLKRFLSSNSMKQERSDRSQRRSLLHYNFALDQYLIADGKLFDIVDEEGRRARLSIP